MKARYLVDPRESNPAVLVIHDLYNCGPTTGQQTITNDAEDVIRDLLKRGLLGADGKRRVLYYDTVGNLDELLHDGNGAFTGFAPGPHRKAVKR